MTPADSWRDRAACKGKETLMWYPWATTTSEDRAKVDTDKLATARFICRSCPVQTQCLDYAITTNQTDGIWAGTLPSERRRLSSMRRGA